MTVRRCNNLRDPSVLSGVHRPQPPENAERQGHPRLTPRTDPGRGDRDATRGRRTTVGVGRLEEVSGLVKRKEKRKLVFY